MSSNVAKINPGFRETRTPSTPRTVSPTDGRSSEPGRDADGQV
jgi:hypothetical protein